MQEPYMIVTVKDLSSEEYIHLDTCITGVQHKWGKLCHGKRDSYLRIESEKPAYAGLDLVYKRVAIKVAPFPRGIIKDPAAKRDISTET